MGHLVTCRAPMPVVASSTVVLKLFNNQAATSDTTSFFDQSSGAHTATVVGDLIWVTRTAFVWATGNQTAVVMHGFIADGGYVTFPSHADFGFGTGDFTIKLRHEQTVDYQYGIYDQRTADPDVAPCIYVKVGGTVEFYANGGAVITSSAGLITVDGLAHEIEWSRVSGVSYMFFDGSLVSSVADVNNYVVSPVTVGCFWGGSIAERTGGLLASVIVTKGLGEHTASYTPGTLPY